MWKLKYATYVYRRCVKYKENGDVSVGVFIRMRVFYIRNNSNYFDAISFSSLYH